MNYNCIVYVAPSLDVSHVSRIDNWSANNTLVAFPVHLPIVSFTYGWGLHVCVLYFNDVLFPADTCKTQ